MKKAVGYPSMGCSALPIRSGESLAMFCGWVLCLCSSYRCCRNFERWRRKGWAGWVEKMGSNMQYTAMCPSLEEGSDSWGLHPSSSSSKGRTCLIHFVFTWIVTMVWVCESPKSCLEGECCNMKFPPWLFFNFKSMLKEGCEKGFGASVCEHTPAFWSQWGRACSFSNK